jgi:pimeloyl-ACP methyl ester carboxylesterase
MPHRPAAACRLAVVLALLPLLSGHPAAADDRPGGLARKGLLGAQLRPLTTDELKTRRVFGTGGAGVVIEGIVPDSTAAAAGLRGGDILVSVGGTRIASPDELIAAISGSQAGEPLTIEFVRDGDRRTATTALRRRPFETSDAYEVVYGSVVSRGKRLRTILTRPKGQGKHPALFLIQGLGSFSIENTAAGAGAYARIIDEFTRRGFVTMRVDKPGQGDSEGGPTRDIDFETELDGYRQALRALRASEAVDPESIFIFGHSMGGVMAPLLAADIPARGIAAFGTVVKTWHEYTLENARRQMALAGTRFAEIERNLRLDAAIDHYLAEGLSPSAIAMGHPELKDRVADWYSDGTHHADTHHEYFRQLARKNLAEAWERYGGHALTVWGKSDFISGEEDHTLIARIVNRDHPGRGTFLTLEGIDHAFCRAASQEESFRDFRKPDRPLNPAFFDALRDWAVRVCAVPAPAPGAPAAASRDESKKPEEVVREAERAIKAKSWDDGEEPTVDRDHLSRIRYATPAPLVSTNAILAPSSGC